MVITVRNMRLLKITFPWLFSLLIKEHYKQPQMLARMGGNTYTLLVQPLWKSVW
jgi:hypothetical protein